MIKLDSVNNHLISINERKGVTITGIKSIDSFDSEEFLLSSSFGPLLLKGESLEIIKLDLHDGNISIKGKINSIAYLDDVSKQKENTIFKKLFKWVLQFN